MKICFATHNENKLKEIRNRIGSGLSIVSLTDLGLTEEIPETGTTLEENSLIKAKFVFDKFGIPVFADDTGLEVMALNNEPGVYSARYAGNHKSNEDNIQLLLKNLSGMENREARFKTVVTFMDSNTEKQFTGIAKGVICTERFGKEGFGYDPIFRPEGEKRTFAEMSMDEKNAISHRSRAFDQLVDYLNSK